MSISKRYAALIEYDGNPYCGWQRQSHASSVQETVESAITKVANHDVSVVCAGRTDTGVHALGQVVHFDSAADRSLRQWQLGVNSNLPPSVSVRDICTVEAQFHARFSATSRSYVYLILNAVSRSAIQYRRVAWIHDALNEELMHQAAQSLLGEHDFTSFRALACQAHSPVRKVQAIEVWRQQSLIFVSITANAFLHHMVRNIVGSLIAVGRKEYSPEWIEELLRARDRAQAGVTAPAAGLYLVRVGYDGEQKPGFSVTPDGGWCVYAH